MIKVWIVRVSDAYSSTISVAIGDDKPQIAAEEGYEVEIYEATPTLNGDTNDPFVSPVCVVGVGTFAFPSPLPSIALWQAKARRKPRPPLGGISQPNTSGISLTLMAIQSS